MTALAEPMTVPAAGAELLRYAAAEVTDETWCQFSYAVRHDGTATDDYMDTDVARLCVQGHLLRASRLHPDIARDERLRAQGLLVAITALDGAVPDPGFLAPDWNDVVGRRAAEIRALLVRAADSLEVTR